MLRNRDTIDTHMTKKPKDITIIVASHKNYPMPDDEIYLPLHVGKNHQKGFGFQGDDTGNNISKKNSGFCELTGLYWAWKNLNSDYIGLAHYRRHFRGKNKGDKKIDQVITHKELMPILEQTDIVLPKKRRYYIETIKSHYCHTMHEETLDETIKIIEEKYPEYHDSLEKVMNHRYMHAFNMFVMKKAYFDEYCSWLFDILFELENRMKNQEYDAFHSRFYGRISELLLDVWLDYKGYNYREVPFIYLEKINWPQKISRFLAAKFLGKKYDKSF